VFHVLQALTLQIKLTLHHVLKSLTNSAAVTVPSPFTRGFDFQVFFTVKYRAILNEKNNSFKSFL